MHYINVTADSVLGMVQLYFNHQKFNLTNIIVYDGKALTIY